MNTRKGIPLFLVFTALVYTEYSRGQYLKDIDRKEIGELSKILPPPNTIELKLIRSFPTQSQEDAGHYLPQPSSFARDPFGNVLITDTKANVIYKYDSAGNYTGQYGRPGQGPGDLSLPMRIDIFDDTIHVHDVGNRRLQYFDIRGRYIRVVRVFKDYTDLVFMRDGQIIGTPLYIDRAGEEALVEVMASDGKRVRAFGTPIDFKYDRNAMNSRKILINGSNEIIIVFECLPILQKYSVQGRLLQEIRLETEFSYQKEIINRRMNSYFPDQKAAKIVIFCAAGILKDTIYIVDYVQPIMWIWAVDDNFKVTRTYYWTNKGDYVCARQILPTVENGHIFFAVLGATSQGGEERIHIFSPK